MEQFHTLEIRYDVPRDGLSVCVVCQGIEEEDHPRGCRFEWAQHHHGNATCFGYAYGHYPNLVLLSESARNGCPVCAFLLRVLQEQTDSHNDAACHNFANIWADAKDSERRRPCLFDLKSDMVETARMLKQKKDKAPSEWRAPDIEYIPELLRDWDRIVLFKIADTPVVLRTQDKDDSYITIPSITRDPQHTLLEITSLSSPADSLEPGLLSSPAQDLLSEPHTELVRRWMKTCATKHEKCHAHVEPRHAQTMPTRVLQISSSPVIGEIVAVRLIEAKGNKEDYACLSYCWGQSPQKNMTTKSNFAQHLVSIELDSLPETIIDALKLCCKLGLRYVWVDSLCIIQDDEDDWLREASTMAMVYSNSLLTLATHLCGDSSESFLQNRQHQVVSLSNGAQLAYMDRSSGEERRLHFWAREYDSARFLQDRWGRTSVASYRRGSHWLDRAWVLQEWLLSPRVLHIHDTTIWDCLEGYGNELEQRFLGEPPISRDMAGMQVAWEQLVTQFTERGITNDMDRLPALAGLAEKYRDKTGHRYLAGLWLEDLPGSLLWQRQDEYLTAPTTYRAPSWSWASLEGPIWFCGHCYFEDDWDFVTSIISAHCEYYPPSHLSTVKSGSLRVQGPICPVVKWRVPARSDSQRRIGILVDADGDWEKQSVGWLDRNLCLEEDIARSKVYLLSIAENDGSADGIILLKTDPIDGMDTFRRLGMMMSDHTREQSALWKRTTICLT